MLKLNRCRIAATALYGYTIVFGPHICTSRPAEPTFERSCLPCGAVRMRRMFPSAPTVGTIGPRSVAGTVREPFRAIFRHIPFMSANVRQFI